MGCLRGMFDRELEIPESKKIVMSNSKVKRLSNKDSLCTDALEHGFEYENNAFKLK